MNHEKDWRIAELHTKNIGLQHQLHVLQISHADLVEACTRLLQFNTELCRDVNVSTHYPSADFARQVIARAEALSAAPTTQHQPPTTHHLRPPRPGDDLTQEGGRR